MKVIVGTSEVQVVYNLHESLLQEKSEFFRAALGGEWMEAAMKEVHLREEKILAFDWFVEWIYLGDLKLQDAGVDFIPVYVLADKLLCHDLKNRAIDMLQQYYLTTAIAFKHITIVTEKGLTDSKLMEYLLTQLAYEVSRHYDDMTKDDGWLDLLASDAEVTKRLIDKLTYYVKSNNAGDPAETEGCLWHEHGHSPARPCQRQGKHA